MVFILLEVLSMDELVCADSSLEKHVAIAITHNDIRALIVIIL